MSGNQVEDRLRVVEPAADVVEFFPAQLLAGQTQGIIEAITAGQGQTGMRLDKELNQGEIQPQATDIAHALEGQVTVIFGHKVQVGSHAFSSLLLLFPV